VILSMVASPRRRPSAARGNSSGSLNLPDGSVLVGREQPGRRARPDVNDGVDPHLGASAEAGAVKHGSAGGDEDLVLERQQDGSQPI